MGRTPILDMTYDEFKAKTIGYTKIYGNNPDFAPSLPNYATEHMGISEAKIQEIIREGKDSKSTYYNHAQLLIWLIGWMRGQIFSSPGWEKRTAAEKIFALKQLKGDGIVYSDGFDDKKNGSPKITINFGAGDKRGGGAFG